MKHLCTLSIVCLLLLGISCQPNQSPKKTKAKIFSQFFVQYRQSGRLFRAEANFAVGDSLATAANVEMQSVRFQGSQMELKSKPNGNPVYKTEISGDFQNEMRLKFNRSNEEEHNIVLQFSPIESFLVKGDVSKKNGLTLVWKGLPLQEQEELLLFFADKNNKAASHSLIGPTQRSEVTLDGKFLSELEAGRGNLFLVKKKKGSENQKAVSTYFELEYYTNALQINIL